MSVESSNPLNQIQNLLSRFNQPEALPLQKLPEAKNLIQVLESFNKQFAENPNQAVLIGKKWTEQELKKGMEAAVKTLSVFQENQTDQTTLRQRTVHQALISLIFSKLSFEVESFKKNLRMLKDLKKWKKGARVEKIGGLNKKMRQHPEETEE